MVRALHDVEPAAVLGVLRRAAEQLRQPHREPVGMVVARLVEQRSEQVVGEHQPVERVGEAPHPGRATAQLEHRRRHGRQLFTGVGGSLPSSTASAFLAASTPIAVRVSIVAEPRWGRSTTFSSSSRPGCTSGSRSNTSSPAPAIVPVAQRLDQRGLVDDRAARRVDEVRGRLHLRRARGVDQVARLGRQRAVQRDDVGGREQLVERAGSAPRARRSTAGSAAAAAGVDDRPSRTRGRGARSRAPIWPEADDAERLALDARAEVEVHAPRPGAPARTSRSPSPSRRVAIRISANAMSAVASVRTPGVFVTITPRAAQAGDVDVVVADRDVRDDPQLRAGGVEQRVVDAVVQQRDDGVGAGDRVVQLVRRSAAGRAARPRRRRPRAAGRAPARGSGA